MQDRATVASGLKELKEKYKVTQKELANIAGVSEVTVSSWIKGRTDAGIKSKEQLKLIANHFNESYSIFERQDTNEEKARRYYDAVLKDNDLFAEDVDGYHIESDSKRNLYNALSNRQEETKAAIAYLLAIDELGTGMSADVKKARGDRVEAIYLLRKLEIFNYLSEQLWDWLSTYNPHELENTQFNISMTFDGHHPILKFFRETEKRTKPMAESENEFYSKLVKKVEQHKKAFAEVLSSMQISIDEEPEKEKK